MAGLCLEAYHAYSAAALANHHILMTEDSRVCLLCWAERPPPGLHGKWLSIIWEEHLICFRGHVEEGSLAVGSKFGMRAGAIAAAALYQIWPCLMFKEPEMFGINISEPLCYYSQGPDMPPSTRRRYSVTDSVTIYWTPSVYTRQCTRCWWWMRSFCQEVHSLAGGTYSYYK